MSHLHELDREELLEVLTRIEELAEETAAVWKGQIATHDTHCHTRHAGCLAAAVLEVGERKTVAAYIGRIERLLDATHEGTEQ